MRKAKLSFDLFAQQHGNDGLSTGAQKPEHLSQTTMCMRISSKNNIVRGLHRSISRRPPSPQAKGFGLRVSTGTQGSAILLRKQVSQASIPRLSAPASHHLPLYQDNGYAHILKGYFYTNLGGTLTLAEANSCPCRAAHFELRSFHDSGAWPHEPLNFSVFVFAFASLYLGLSQDVE